MINDKIKKNAVNIVSMKQSFDDGIPSSIPKFKPGDVLTRQYKLENIEFTSQTVLILEIVWYVSHFMSFDPDGITVKKKTQVHEYKLFALTGNPLFKCSGDFNAFEPYWKNINERE